MRACGILMHISSLPSDFGIGTLGSEAYRFVDFLEKSGQTFWQILPVCPTSFGDSPYQSFSTFAGNPYFIDLDMLKDSGLLYENEYKELDWGKDERYVDFELMFKTRYTVLRKAFSRFKENIPEDFSKFRLDNSKWLLPYALYMSLKDYHGGKSWSDWEPQYKMSDKAALEGFEEHHSDEIMFYEMLQYLFYKQWFELKSYANSKGIKIIGDIPIYVAADSADTWSNPELFQLDENYDPVMVAGCPPDGFSEDGQLWGNPLYNWDKMKKNGYDWWIKRIESASEIYDVIRIDHFRGFDSYYSIPAKDDTAKNGVWRQGPGMDFISAVKNRLGRLNIIAEDLGFLTPSVKKLLKNFRFPGMKVLQFAFDSREESDYLPHNYTKNCVVYTGTHDNDTIIGWLKTLKRSDRAFAKRYLRLRRSEGYNWGVMCGALASTADTCILTMQDLLGLGSEARMNTPSTLGGINWKWRAVKKDINDELAKKLLEYTGTYKRIRKGFIK